MTSTSVTVATNEDNCRARGHRAGWVAYTDGDSRWAVLVRSCLQYGGGKAGHCGRVRARRASVRARGLPGRAGLLRRIKMIDGRTFGLASAGIVVAVARPSSSRAAGRRHHGRAPLPR